MPQNKTSFSLSSSIFFVCIGLFLLAVTLYSASRNQDNRQNAQGPRVGGKSENVAVRGVAGDLWADVVLGKRDFVESSAREIVDYKLNIPGGVAIDDRPEGEFMYVWDSGNNRIVGFYLKDCPNPDVELCHAKIIIGQPSGFDYGACNQDSSGNTFPDKVPARADTICATSEFTQTTLEYKSFAGLAIDAEHALYVTDTTNNRILKYLDPLTTDGVADDVWGQPSFSDNYCNQKNDLPRADTLCTFHEIPEIDRGTPGSDLAFDAQGNLWVVDAGNNRILRYPMKTTARNKTISKTADLVIGQPNFTTRSRGSALSQLWVPRSLSFSPDGTVLLVADSDNKRILQYSAPFTTGMSGVVFAPNYSFALINSIKIDPFGRGIWVYNTTTGNDGLRAIELVLFDKNSQTRKHGITIGMPGGGSMAVGKTGLVYLTPYQNAGHTVMEIQYNE